MMSRREGIDVNASARSETHSNIWPCSDLVATLTLNPRPSKPNQFISSRSHVSNQRHSWIRALRRVVRKLFETRAHSDGRTTRKHNAAIRRCLSEEKA